MDMKQGVIERIQGGGKLQTAPTGPILPRFDPHALAAAIELEIERANICGFSRMSIHMDIYDAAMLAKHLRK